MIYETKMSVGLYDSLGLVLFRKEFSLEGFCFSHVVHSPNGTKYMLLLLAVNYCLHLSLIIFRKKIHVNFDRRFH